MAEVITVTRGDTLRKKVNIYKNGEVYTPAEGEKVRFAMKKSYSDEFCSLKKDVPVDTLVLELKPEDTKHLKFGSYVFDFELTDKDERVYTFLKGQLVLDQEVF